MGSLAGKGSWSRDRALFHLRRLSINTTLQVAGQVLPLVAGVAAFPVIYANISSADFGIFTIALSILGLFSLLDLGLGRASVRFMARAFAEGDPDRAASIAAHSAVLLGGFSLTLCLVFVLIIPAIQGFWIQGAGAADNSVRHSLLILAIALPFVGLTSVLRSVFEAREDFRTIGIIQAALGTLTYIVPLVLSFVTTDVRALIVGAVACRALAFFAFLLVARQTWVGEFPWRVVDLREQQEFRQFSFWLVLSNLVGIGIVFGDRALLLHLFPLDHVPFYNVPLEVLSRLFIVVNAAATVVFPVLSRSANNKVLLDRVYVGMITVLSAVVGCVLLSLSIFAPTILDLWLGGEFREHSTDVVRILIVGLAVQSLNTMALASLNAQGMAKPITLMHLVETPVYFGLLYLCGLNFGLVGVAIVWSGRLIAEYICFAGLQIYIGSRENRGAQCIGIALAAANIIPAIVMAISQNAKPAIAVCMATAGLSFWWVHTVWSRLRAGENNALSDS